MFYALNKDHDLSYFFEHIIGITRTNAIAVADQINKTVFIYPRQKINRNRNKKA